MAKRKGDFKPLTFINPFDEKNLKRMVYEEWSNRDKFYKWRVENSKFIKDPKMIDHLDADELITQWDIHPLERKVNPKTTIMIFKELCLVLRLVDAEHQDIVLRNVTDVPGVVKSSYTDEYIFVQYDLEESRSKASRVKRFKTEEEAYEEYRNNRDTIIAQTADKALSLSLIDPEVYKKYFGPDSNIRTREYSYYKNQDYHI